MTLRAVRVLGASIVGASLVALAALGSVAAAAGPPLPKVAHGGKAQLFASGVGTPTAFAFGAGKVFVSDGTLPPPGGGVYVIDKGKARLLPGSPVASLGVTWHKGTLYVSALTTLQAWSGWDGTKFTKQRTIYTAPKGFPGFNGIAFGADGRLYAGVDVGQTNDHGPATAPYQYDILSFTAGGKGLKVVAKGIRQPWQFAFSKGSSSPFVSDLGQDKPASVAGKVPDFVLRVRKGDNYGFPKCNWVSKKACKHFSKPLQFFAPHADVGGLGILGNRLYISEFGFVRAPRVVSMPLTGGRPTPFATHFAGAIVGLGVHDGWVYVGQLADPTNPTAHPGLIYRLKP
jgi:glucose/arabinose dehydrogenase